MFFSFSLRRSNLIIHQDFKVKNPRNFRKTAKNRLLFCKRPAATILTKEYFRFQGISADCYLDVSERTFMSEPIENHAISKLFNVNVNNRRRRFRE